MAVLRTVLGIVLGIQLSFAQMPDSGARADELLARWHRVRQLVVDGALGQDQRREAAMVLVQGQFLANFDASHDPQFAEWVESAAGSRQDVRLRLAGALADLDAPGDRFAGRRGSFFSAYTSTMDGSGQIYSLYVPETYDPTEAHALELRPHSNLKFREPVEFTGAHIVAVCQGRGIEGLGELDAREVLLDVSTHYNIDPDRVYLSGGSIGGGAVWRMLGRYPDLFAAARIDYGWTWGTSRLFLENASNVPISIYHAADDVWVPVEESRAAVRFLADLGSPVLYNETSGGGHSQRQKDPAWSTDDWLLAQRREPYPTQVHYATTTPLRGRSYWLDIREFSDPNKLVRVRARVGEDATGTQLYLHMENIDVLAVDLPRQLFAADRELIVTVGGATLRIAAPLPARVYVHRGAHTSYGLAMDDPRPPPPYRPYAAGGPNSLYTSGEPLMIVCGTGGDNLELTEAIKRFCGSLSRGANKGWSVFPMHESITGAIPVKADTAVTREDKRTHNLIVVGSVESNALLARITARLPAVERGGLLQIQREEYDLTGGGYGLFYYNPEAQDRYVLVLSSPEAAFYTLNNGITDLMGEDRPFGLVARRVDQQHMIRRIAWAKDWSVPAEAMRGEKLSAVFSQDRDKLRDFYHQALLDATGAEYLDYWNPNYFPLWESGARWHDLAADVGQPRMYYAGWASGADLVKLAAAEQSDERLKMGVFPLPESLQPAADYRFVTGSTWGFVNALQHPLREAVAVRVDLYEALRRTAQRHR